MIKMKTTGNVMGLLLALAVVFCTPRAEAGVALGATRVIYPAEQKQVTLGVSNNNDKDTFLIQSWVENDDGQKEGRFVITPPLFLMQGKKKIRCVLLMQPITPCLKTAKVFSGSTSKPFLLWTRQNRKKTRFNWR